MSITRRKFFGFAGAAAVSAGAFSLVTSAQAAPAGSREVKVPADGIYKGRVWVFGDDIWSSYILTAEGMTMPLEEAQKVCMKGIRDGWYKEVKPGDIIVAGRSFGMGSGRDATGLLKYMGIAAVVAESIMPIFTRNCVNAGWAFLECPGVHALFKDGDQIEFNLHTGVVRNLTTGKQITGKPLPEEINKLILEGGEEGVLRKEGYIARNGVRKDKILAANAEYGNAMV